jgi:hypothetical protein
VVGGSSPQVQYNNSGALGGISKLTSDGTRINVTGELAHPTAPAAGALHYDWVPDAGFVQFPFTSDAFMGAAVPHGILDAFTTGQGGSNWTWQCSRTVANNIATLYGQAPGQVGWGSAGPAWSSANLLGRINWESGSSGTVATSGQSLNEGTAATVWRGNTAGAGGFIFWTRVALHTTGPHERLFFGLQTTTAFGNVEPSSLSDAVYFGADNGAGGTSANFQVCSNDNSGSATCNDLGSNFPTQTSDAIYDFWLVAGPNASGIAYYAQRLDSEGVATGLLTQDLPRNTIQLRWLDQLGPADGGVSLVGYFHAACLAENM